MVKMPVRGGVKYEVWTIALASFFCVPERIGIYAGWVDVKCYLIMPALRKSTHRSKSQWENRLNQFACLFGGLAIAGRPYSK